MLLTLPFRNTYLSLYSSLSRLSNKFLHRAHGIHTYISLIYMFIDHKKEEEEEEASDAVKLQSLHNLRNIFSFALCVYNEAILRATNSHREEKQNGKLALSLSLSFLRHRPLHRSDNALSIHQPMYIYVWYIRARDTSLKKKSSSYNNSSKQFALSFPTIKALQL